MSRTRKPRVGKSDLLTNLNDLQLLLDGPIGTAPLLKSKPLKPSQVDKLVKRCFNNILSHHRLLRLEITSRSPQIERWRQRAIDSTEEQLRSDSKVIKPASLVYTRRVLVLEQRLKVLDTLWELVLQAYEDYFQTKYEPGGDIK